MRFILCSLVVASPLLLSSCSAHRQVANELQQNQKLWASRHISHYKYTFQYLCYCSTLTTDPVTIEVRNGVQVSISRDKGKPLVSQQFQRFETIDKLFDVVQNAIIDNPDELTVKYDPQFGYPVGIGIDPNKSNHDDEKDYTISNFLVL